MKTYIISSLLVLLALLPAPAGASENALVPTTVHGPYGQVSAWSWQEEGPTDYKESRSLLTIGYVVEGQRRAATPGNWGYVAWGRIENFLGTVDMEANPVGGGARQEGEADYFGFLFNAAFAGSYRSSESLYIEPYGGMTLKYWNREVHRPGMNRVQNEYWQTLDLPVGVRAVHVFHPKGNVTLEAALKVPVSNLIEVDYGWSNVELEPKEEFSYLASLSFRYKYFNAGVFYEEMRYGGSNREAVCGGFICGQPEYLQQPPTRAYMAGLRAGASF